MKPWRVTIHCSDSHNGQIYLASQIDLDHRARGFDKIGYAIVIQPSGEVENGRGLNEDGAHVLGENEGNIGVCLIGRDKFTTKQFIALRYKLDGIRMTYDIKHWNIFCHYEFKSAKDQGKTCPNIRVSDLICWYLLDRDDSILKYFL